jgi:hypothetical protein
MGDKKILFFGEYRAHRGTLMVARPHSASGQRFWGDNVILHV